MPWIVEYRFTDNNGRSAETVLRLPDALSFGEASARAESIAASFDAVTDAVLVEFVISRRSPGPAGSTATALASVRHTTVLFYREGEQVSSIRVPALQPLFFELTGPYQGMRVTRLRLQPLAFLPTFDNLLDGALDVTGRPFPLFFYVGGRDDI